jgi:uncharacterized protein YbjT (DUF2867 family)
MKRNALIAGATGLVGKELVSLLISSKEYESIHIIARRPFDLQHPKLVTYIVDFDTLNQFKTKSVIHDVYICLGTTMKNAGSKECFKKVDYEYVVSVARWAKGNNVEKLALISSMGANLHSKFNFYLGIKGKTEQAVKNFEFKNLIILRPSLLLGKREEFRFAEKVSGLFLKPLLPFMIGKMKKYRPVEARTVASAMIFYTNNASSPVRIIENDEILAV